MKREAYAGTIGFNGVLFLLFLTLKLCHMIGWSWWWVTSPLWIPAAIVLLVFAVVLFFYALLGRHSNRLGR